MKRLVRWTVTVITLASLSASGYMAVRRIVAAVLREQAEDSFLDGDLLGSLAAYDRAQGWDPWPATTDTELGDSVADALAYRYAPLDRQPEIGPDICAAGLESYVRAILKASPSTWSWAGVSRLYSHLSDYRPFIATIDLSMLGTDVRDRIRDEDILAEAALLLALHFEPDNFYYLDSLGELYWELGLEVEAMAQFRHAVEIYPVLDGHYYIADRAEESEAISIGVRKALERALETVPARDRWVIFRELGDLARRRGEDEVSRRAFEKALEVVSSASRLDHAALHSYLGDAHERLGDLDAAMESLRKALALDPGRAQLHGRLGQLLGKAGRHAEATLALATARSLDPSNPSIHRALAVEYHRAGDLDRAERSCAELIRLDPELADGYLLVIQMLRDAGVAPRAIPYARELVRQHPEEPVYRRQLEQLYEDEARP